jgi:hypothetical protein
VVRDADGSILATVSIPGTVASPERAARATSRPVSREKS